jgi:hypothetical protein
LVAFLVAMYLANLNTVSRHLTSISMHCAQHHRDCDRRCQWAKRQKSGFMRRYTASALSIPVDRLLSIVHSAPG